MKAKMKQHKLLGMLLTLVMVMELLPITAMRSPSGRNRFRVLTDPPEATI